MDIPRSEIDSYLDQIDPYEFEKLVADIWENLGFQTSVTQKSNDRGIDVEAIQNRPTEQKALIQAKAYSKGNKVGSAEIRKYATLYQQEDDADQVVVVSTSSYTSEAKRLADDLDVAIKDRNDVIDLINEANIDVDSSSAQSPDYETSNTTTDELVQTGPRTYKNKNNIDQTNKTKSVDHTKPDANIKTDKTKSEDNTENTISKLAVGGSTTLGIIVIIALFSVFIFVTPAEVGEAQEFGEYTLRVENIYTSDTIQTGDGNYEVSDISSFNLQEAESSDAEQFLIIIVDFEETADSSSLSQSTISINKNRYALSTVNEIYINDRNFERFHLSERSQGKRAIIFAVPDKNMSGENLRISAEDSSDFAWWEISGISEL